MNLKKGAINSASLFGATLIGIFLTFVSRFYFIKNLGEQSLGLNSLFNSLLSAISITDAGLDTVLMFILFNPLKEKNIGETTQLFLYIRKLYRLIALFIMVLGLIMMIFLPRMLPTTEISGRIYVIYLLYLVNSVLSYAFAENRVLLNANEESVWVTLFTTMFNFVVLVGQIIVLELFASFELYQLVQLLGTVLLGISLKMFVSRHFDFQPNTSAQISSTTKRILIKNAAGGISNRIGSFAVNGSDSLLLSIFTNLVVVAQYANYMMLVNAVNLLATKTISALTPTIGISFEAQSSEQKYLSFERLNSAMYMLGSLVFTGFLFNANWVILKWLGKNLTLSSLVVYLIALNLMFRISRLGSLNYIDALGLQWNQRFKPLFEAGVNVVMAVVLLLNGWGIIGILMGTIISNITTVLWMEPRYVFKGGVPFKPEFISKILIYIFVNLIVTGVYFWSRNFGDSFVTNVGLTLGTYLVIISVAVIFDNNIKYWLTNILARLRRGRV